MVHEYRLSWESLDTKEIESLKNNYGRDYWQKPRIRALYKDDSELWKTCTVIFRATMDGEDATSEGSHGFSRTDQYKALKKWEDEKIQPIRKVKLERREARDENEGWEPYEE